MSHAATKFANMDMGIQLVAVVVCIDSEASQIGAKRLRGATMATGRCEIKLKIFQQLATESYLKIVRDLQGEIRTPSVATI